MRRTPMKPGKGFANKAVQRYERDADRVRPTPSVRPEFRAAQPVSSAPATPIEKEGAIQSEAYMRVVRLLPCMHCGKAGATQFAHSDSGGKGIGLKTDSRMGMPLCGPHDGVPGCHWLIGTSGRIPREERRALEREYGRKTREKVRAMNLWPKTLPPWNDDAVESQSFKQRTKGCDQ